MDIDELQERILARYPRPDQSRERALALKAYEIVSEGDASDFKAHQNAWEAAKKAEAEARAAMTGAVIAEVERSSQYAVGKAYKIPKDTVARMFGVIKAGQKYGKYAKKSEIG